MRAGTTPFALLLGLAALAGCSNRNTVGRDATMPEWVSLCPALAAYRARNPRIDAVTANRRHDDRLMMLGGADGGIPDIAPSNLSIADQDAAIMLPETGDDDECPSKDARNMARDYAYRYNASMLAALGRGSGGQLVFSLTGGPRS
jgi:hypothetical protein